MSQRLNQTFELLLRTKGNAARELLTAALDEPKPLIQRRAAAALVQQYGDYGMQTLVARFDRLLWQGRAEVVASYERFLPTLRAVLRTGTVVERENSLLILGTVGKPRLALTIAGALTDGSPEIPKLAATQLIAMAQRMEHAIAHATKEGESASWGSENARRELISALRTGIQSYDSHRQLGVIEAFLTLNDTAHNELIALVEAGSAELANDFVSVLRAGAEQLPAGLLMKSLLSESLKVQAAAQQILARQPKEQFAAGLEQHLDGALNERQLTLDDSGAEGWWQIAVDRLDQLGEPFQTKMVHLVVSQLKGDARVERLQDLQPSPYETVRKEIILAAREDSSSAAQRLILSLLADPAESVQLLATQEVMAMEIDAKIGALIKQLNSPFESIRNLAASEVSRTGFQRYLASFDTLDKVTRERAGAALVKLDGGLVHRLTDELTALEPARRLRAVQIVRAIDQAAGVSDLILELVGDADKAVRATAVIALGAIGSGAGLKAMIEALSDTDRRVQANAVEAFEELGQPDFADILLPFARSTDNRIRANTVKALWHLKHPDATKQLLIMIQESDPAMRLSAVWLLGQMPVPGAQTVLNKLASADASDAVRRKAQELLDKGILS